MRNLPLEGVFRGQYVNLHVVRQCEQRLESRPISEVVERYAKAARSQPGDGLAELTRWLDRLEYFDDDRFGRQQIKQRPIVQQVLAKIHE
jgi:hypothetical protein